MVTLKQLNQISDTQESSTQSLRGFHATLGVTRGLTQIVLFIEWGKNKET